MNNLKQTLDEFEKRITALENMATAPAKKTSNRRARGHWLNVYTDLGLESGQSKTLCFDTEQEVKAAHTGLYKAARQYKNQAVRIMRDNNTLFIIRTD